MAQFTVNAARIDPYKNFKFRVRLNGNVVAGVSKVSPLKRTTELVTHREGGDFSTPRLSPGQTKFEPITLERGVTHDTEFEAWANTVHNTSGGDGAVSLKNYKRDITIDVLNLQGAVVKTYHAYRCWVSEYTALPELDANANAVAFESIVIQNEGWERDTGVAEVAES